MLIRAQLAADGASAHDVNQLLQIYATGIEPCNFWVGQGKPVTEQIDRRLKSWRKAGQILRRYIFEKEKERSQERLQSDFSELQTVA